MATINLNDSELEDLCREVRLGAFKMIRKAESGHIGASSSSTELFTTLYFGGVLNYNPNNPFDKDRDIVLVRGHVGPLRYKIFSILGWIDKPELDTYRQMGSRLQGHESMELVPGVDITPSGSLGMLLSYGVGTALANKKQNKSARTYVFLGDGEEQEGNISEAARHATTLSLDNLICILDKNGKQLSHPTSDVDGGNVEDIWKGYGWDVLRINDGHSISEIREVFEKARGIKKPVFIIANTLKGKGIEGSKENYCGYHTFSRCPTSKLDSAIANTGAIKKAFSLPYREFINTQNIQTELNILIPIIKETMNLEEATDIYLPQVEKKITQENKKNFYFMTADLDDTEHIKRYNFTESTRFIDVGIREQHLFSSAYGISLSDPTSRIWIHSGDAFLYRALDQLYSICQGKGKMIIIGERPGLSQGKNGSTHQSVGQPGALLTLPNLTFLEPADTVDLSNCYNYVFSKYPGPSYIRLHSGTIAPLPSEEQKNIENYIVNEGGSKPIST